MIRRGTPKTRDGASNPYSRSERKALRQPTWRSGWAIVSKRTSILLFLTLCGSSLTWATTRVGNTKPLLLHSSAVMLKQLPPVADRAIAPSQATILSQELSPATQQSTQVSVGEALLDQLSPTVEETTPPQRVELVSQAPLQVIRQGTQMSLNGRMVTGAWKQWKQGASVRIGISDVGLMQTLGMALLSTKDLTQQQVQWFSWPPSTPLSLATQLDKAYRYLDVTDFAKVAGLQLQVAGDQLRISSVPTRVKNISAGAVEWGSRIVVDLDRPIPWQVSDQRTEGVITLDASIDPSLIGRFSIGTPPATPPAPPKPPHEDEGEGTTSVPTEINDARPVLQIENSQNQTTLRVSIPEGKRLQVYSLPNPNRLVIDLRPDVLVEKEILWAPGIRWRQQYVTLGTSQFPVVWLEVDPRSSDVSLKPIWGNPTTQVGTAPLIQTAKGSQAIAAINAGFFNRNNQLPLGAIRRDNRWFSGPILNRGAIAWNDSGQFKFGRLSLQETLITPSGERLPIPLLNSGYVQPGIARYSPEWGATYTPLADNEVLAVVQNNQVTAQMPGGAAGQTSFPIPNNGYLLTLRSDGTNATAALGVGTQLRLESATSPSEFGSYPHILGAGPLLIQNRKIVLDAKAEQFSNAFIQQAAIRSCVGTTATGTLMLVAIHNRIGGAGPTLAEAAQLMQLLGVTDAINFDGGSSTGLYLGGQLIDRSPYTAARVHNGLGIFLPSLR